MFRLPSAAMRRSLPATKSVGDTPLQVEDDCSADESPAQSRRRSINRSRFFLAHTTSATLEDVYDVEAIPIGAGGFGTVHRATLKAAGTDVVRAVKSISQRNVKAYTMARAEINILRRLDHPNICRLLETFEDREHIYLVMEYVDGKELFDHIQDSINEGEVPEEAFAARVMKQVLSALQYCCAVDVVHCDLKPENIMVQRTTASTSLNDCVVKLIDFGLARLCRAARRSWSDVDEFCGTECYLAPEVRRRGSASPASDIWSLGMVLHALLAGGLPADSVASGQEPLDISCEDYLHVSMPARRLLVGLLQTDPGRRLSAAEAAAQPWVFGLGGDSVPSKSPPQVKDTLTAFMRFRQSTTLRRAVLTALSMQAVVHVAQAQEVFEQLDQDGNGRISRAELAALFEPERLNSEGFPTAVSTLVDSIFAVIDTDGSQEIEFTEFMAAAMGQVDVYSKQAMWAAFRVLDKDRSGKISQAEFAHVLAQAASDVARFVPLFDTDGDGELDFEEFCSLLCDSPKDEAASAAASPPARDDSSVSSCSCSVISAGVESSSTASTSRAVPLSPGACSRVSHTSERSSARRRVVLI